MALKTLGAKAAAALDKDLMSAGAFSLDQLMELAGLSVSQAARAATFWWHAVPATMVCNLRLARIDRLAYPVVQVETDW
ncbi:yjeF-related protein [Verticillium alfalfae VaMs.102]|uniref:YjeF-related protein n=1 Tax=Verticillium alfalfae (strain VaMs.102 / ATCC MYA-4576 / FGSC 10136) TaxID=526221 RepID=C9SA00_VERA1|nr:yjeF-related protein [Verticillium alfalfae VaMs.102]EEY16213.1 yjeF-related protein [Verticillium alfalfae VaMs.102]